MVCNLRSVKLCMVLEFENTKRQLKWNLDGKGTSKKMRTLVKSLFLKIGNKKLRLMDLNKINIGWKITGFNNLLQRGHRILALGAKVIIGWLNVLRKNPSAIVASNRVI